MRYNFRSTGTVSDNFQTSGYHRGDALYALDISGGTGTELSAPAEGTLIKVDLLLGNWYWSTSFQAEKSGTPPSIISIIFLRMSQGYSTGLLDSLARIGY